MSSIKNISAHAPLNCTLETNKQVLIFLDTISRTSNIAFLMDWGQMSNLDFSLIRQNISIKKASFQYQGCPLSLKSGKLWLNSYIYWISISSDWFYRHQFSLPYSKNILSIWPFRGDKKKIKKSIRYIRQNFSIKKIFLFLLLQSKKTGIAV